MTTANPSGRRSPQRAVGGLWALVGLIAWLGPPALGAPLALCDYTPPQSQFIDLQTALDFRAVATPGQRPLYNGNFKLNGVYLADSQTRGATINGQLMLDLNDESLNKVSLGPNYKFFLAGTSFFTFLGVDAQGTGAIAPRSLGISLLTGYGYGRFRDVTPLALALRIQGQLLRLGRLEEPLPDETLGHLADLIGQRAQAERALETLITQIQEVLERSGLLVGQTLGAPGLLAIEQVLQDKSSSKFCGWETQLGLELGLLQPQGKARQLLGSFAFRYALAPATRSQFTLSSKWSFAPDLFDTFFLSTQAEYSYRFSEFIQAQGRYTFLRSSSRDSPPFDAQTLNVALLFKFLEPALSLRIDLDFALTTGAPGWSRSLTLNLGYEVF